MKMRVCLLLFNIISITDSLKVLQIAYGYSSSHVLFNYRIASTIQSLGHNVTMWNAIGTLVGIGKFPSTPKGVIEHRLDLNLGDDLRQRGSEMLKRFNFHKETFEDMSNLSKVYNTLFWETCQQQQENYEDLIETLSQENFDLTIGHTFGLCPVILSHRMGIKRLALVSPGTFLPETLAWSAGIPTLASTVPFHMGLYSDVMTFTERLINLAQILSIYIYANHPSSAWQNDNRILQSPPNTDLPSAHKLITDIETIFINGERQLDFVKPGISNLKFLGSLGEKKKEQKKLDSRFGKIMDDADAVILFSLGTVANTSDMPRKMKLALLNGLAQLKEYTIIWKFQKSDLPEAAQYKHILLETWLPQRELLNHPKTKLFMTHGGYNSLLETTKSAVPMVLMPLMADQMANVVRAKRYGLGEVLNLKDDDLAADKVAATVQNVLNDSSYKRNAMKTAKILEEKLVSAEKELDYNLRAMTKPRNRRMSAAIRLNIFQLYCLDVICFWLASFIVFLYVVFKATKSLIIAGK